MKRLMIFCLLATVCVLGISAQDKHSCCGECAK